MTRYQKCQRTPTEARAFLHQRYYEQGLRYPLLWQTITAQQYIRVNLKAARTYYKEKQP
jgi:hypothetical protein